MARGDSDIENLLGQVEAALSDLNLDGLSTGLVIGLRDALEGLGSVEADIDSQVIVLDGAGEPSELPAPDLHLVDPDDDIPSSVDEPQVSVRVLRKAEPLDKEGRIVVQGDRQTVFRGEVPRAYRVGCTSGSFQLVADGGTLDTMRPGTTIDVEARRISVTGDGRGAYTRLP